MTNWSSLVWHPRTCWQMMRQRNLWERENGWVMASLPPGSLGLTRRLAYSIWISIIFFLWAELWALRQSQSPVHTARFSVLTLVGSYLPSACHFFIIEFFGWNRGRVVSYFFDRPEALPSEPPVTNGCVIYREPGLLKVQERGTKRGICFQAQIKMWQVK